MLQVTTSKQKLCLVFRSSPQSFSVRKSIRLTGQFTNEFDPCMPITFTNTSLTSSWSLVRSGISEKTCPCVRRNNSTNSDPNRSFSPFSTAIPSPPSPEPNPIKILQYADNQLLCTSTKNISLGEIRLNSYLDDITMQIHVPDPKKLNLSVTRELTRTPFIFGFIFWPDNASALISKERRAF